MPDSTYKYTNDLAGSSSPYLKQHAHNPVDWMPWCNEAFEKAETKNKLLFISIGYSACHWCHVMEHETFENKEAAAFINEHFISIKVDREERPDLDAVYMHAVQIMTGRGGWPLNCIALPDGRPIFGGTYFRTQPFLERLQSIISLKSTDPEKVEEYACNLAQGIAESDLISAPKGDPWQTSKKSTLKESLDSRVDEWKTSWDRKMGLTKGAPKFPLPTNIDFALHYGLARNDQDSLSQVRLTLQSMARGGIYDHLSGGFARYSIDDEWKVPHFEKMLYDNAQLLTTFSHAYSTFKDPTFKNVALSTADFIYTEFCDPLGGFRSSLDADSEGVEGKYYVWSKAELQEILTPDECSIAFTTYDIDGKSYWEHGNNVLMKWQSDSVLAYDLGLSLKDYTKAISAINSKLFEQRSSRIKPGLDDKVLTSWTALTVSGLATTYRVFQKPQHLAQAQTALNFILEKCRLEDRGLYHKYHPETGHSIPGFLEDYAFTIKACLDLYEATFDERYLTEARDLLNISFDKFYDPRLGTFWFTASDEKELFVRKQENHDSVIPSSNSTMAINLFKLGRYFARPEWVERSDRMLFAAWADSHNIETSSNWGIALLYRTQPFNEIAITSNSPSDLASARFELDLNYNPQTLLAGGGHKTVIPKWLHVKAPRSSTKKGLQFFVCNEGACKLPFQTIKEVRKQLNLKH